MQVVDISSTKSENESISPLDRLINLSGGPQDAGIWLTELRHTGKLILRGNSDDSRFTKPVDKVLGNKLPLTPNTFVQNNQQTTIWLGPDEWLINCFPGDENTIENNLNNGLSRVSNSVTNVSDNSTIIQISGSKVRTAIRKGCSIDIHPRAFQPGQAVQSHLALASIVLWQIDQKPTYNILVRSSFSSYLWQWLLDAGAEFGIHIEK